MGLYQDVLESTDGGAFVNLRDGGGTVLTSTNLSGKQALDVNVANSITVGIADKTTYTYGTTSFLPVGGVFQSTSPTLTAGQSGSFRLTASRAVMVNLQNSSGTELGDSNADGLFVKLGDGTNTGSFSATSEQFTQLRQGGNVANVTASNELKVIDTNAGSILALMKSATGTISNPTITTSSSTALASNAARKGFSLFNNSAFAVYLAMAATATSTAFTVRINANSVYEQLSERVYTGIVTMISPTVTGTPSLAVTEYT